jgi:hypothetical protein
MALNNPGLTRSPLRLVFPIIRGTARVAFTVLVSPLLLLAAIARFLGKPQFAEVLLLRAMKAPLFLPAVARQLIPVYFRLGKISRATKLAMRLIIFSPRPHGDRRFSEIWTHYLSTVPQWRPFVNADYIEQPRHSVLVLVGPKTNTVHNELLIQLENSFAADVHHIDVSSPRALPAVAESLLDGMCTDIAVSLNASAKSPELIVVLLDENDDHITALCAVTLSQWSNSKSLLIINNPETIDNSLSSEYAKRSTAKLRELQKHFTVSTDFAHAIQSVESLRGTQS